MFGRATITLGIGPHSSSAYFMLGTHQHKYAALMCILDHLVICGYLCVYRFTAWSARQFRVITTAYPNLAVTHCLRPPCVADAGIIFLPCGFFLLLSIFFSFLA